MNEYKKNNIAKHCFHQIESKIFMPQYNFLDIHYAGSFNIIDPDLYNVYLLEQIEKIEIIVNNNFEMEQIPKIIDLIFMNLIENHQISFFDVKTLSKILNLILFIIKKNPQRTVIRHLIQKNFLIFMRKIYDSIHQNELCFAIFRLLYNICKLSNETINIILDIFEFDIFQISFFNHNDIRTLMLKIFVQFLSFPIDKRILKRIFFLINQCYINQNFSSFNSGNLLCNEQTNVNYLSKNNIKEMLLIFKCIVNSKCNERWIEYYLKYNLNSLINYQMHLYPLKFKNLYSLPKYLMEKMEILDYISELSAIHHIFLENIFDIIMNNLNYEISYNNSNDYNLENFYILILNILSKPLINDEEREYILKLGLINAFLIFSDDGSFKVKTKTFDTIEIFVQNGHQKQRILLVVYNLIDFIFSMLQTTDVFLIIRGLKILDILAQDSIDMNVESILLECFQGNRDIIERLTMFENENINSLSKSLLMFLYE